MYFLLTSCSQHRIWWSLALKVTGLHQITCWLSLYICLRLFLAISSLFQGLTLWCQNISVKLLVKIYNLLDTSILVIISLFVCILIFVFVLLFTVYRTPVSVNKHLYQPDRLVHAQFTDSNHHRMLMYLSTKNGVNRTNS